jgi:hypothetical protein
MLNLLRKEYASFFSRGFMREESGAYYYNSVEI